MEIVMFGAAIMGDHSSKALHEYLLQSNMYLHIYAAGLI